MTNREYFDRSTYNFNEQSYYVNLCKNVRLDLVIYTMLTPRVSTCICIAFANAKANANANACQKIICVCGDKNENDFASKIANYVEQGFRCLMLS